MGRKIREDESESESEEEEEEECVCRSVQLAAAAALTWARLSRRLEFETDADTPWEDPSEDGVLGVRRLYSSRSSALVLTHATPGELFDACEIGDEDTVRRLAPQCASYLASGTLGPDGDTCMHLAAIFSHDGVFDVLLSHGASLHTLDDNKGTVLVRAARRSSSFCVRSGGPHTSTTPPPPARCTSFRSCSSSRPSS